MTSAGQKILTTSQPSHPPHQHPRRPPAHRSVSLLHPREQKQTDLKSHESSSNGSAGSPSNNTPTSHQPLAGKGSSGESSNVDNWFDESNNELRNTNVSSFSTDDPPFFLHNSSSSETPPDIQRQRVAFTKDNDRSDSLPLRANLLRLGTDSSTAEAYRAVIDDLTVENKKLKRKLKKYEKLHDSHLKDEKLFEVRVHGLPAEQKLDLEETLRKFASSVGSKQAPAFASDGHTNVSLKKQASKATSSQTSLRNVDSAYASMSASAPGSAVQSGSGRQTSTPTQFLASRNNNIHNYLHDIPESLLSQNRAAMTERDKQKLVVRRMEQIFVGKGAEIEAHQQSLQQQEISTNAAKADSSAAQAAGQSKRHEGMREANIMDRETIDPMDSKQPHEPATERSSILEYPIPQDFAIRVPAQGAQTESEQRPTRPLDLDLNRAQIPADNVRYMRHLGFSSPVPGPINPPQEGHGWIYLNFLINMAQLHTINVTSDFVRKALTDYSDRFEMSHDGRKVRWRGGASLSRTSSSGEQPSDYHIGDSPTDEQRPHKRVRLAHDDSLRSSLGSTSRRPQSHIYTPLFSHKDDTSDTGGSSSEQQDTSESSSRPTLGGPNSQGVVSPGMITNAKLAIATRTKRKSAKDGPIIFYSNARFCTDLSGDRKTRARNNALLYNVATRHPLGKEYLACPRTLEKRGPLANASVLPEPINISDNPIPDVMEISLPPEYPPRPRSRSAEEVVEFEATGIGGVWPADNFTVSVESFHTHLDQSGDPETSKPALSSALPPRLAELLSRFGARSKPSTSIRNEILASDTRNLPPSVLPPALSFVSPDNESSDEDVSDDEGDLLAGIDSPVALPPSTAPQPVDFAYNSYDEEDDDDADDESDVEVDFLAAARAIDPEAIRAKEREYDAEMAERLAEEIPPGNSAATTGGGSGFVSPSDGVTREEYRQTIEAGRAAFSQWKRATSRDSIEARKSETSGDEEISDVGS